MMEIQVTVISTTGKYKPISAIIKVESVKDFNDNKQMYKRRALEKMCAQRYWDGSELVKYGYSKYKYRVYDKEKIAQENKERYAQIKKERGWE